MFILHPLTSATIERPRSVCRDGRRGARAKAAPVCQYGCPDLGNPSGQWNWLRSVKDLDGLDLREDAVCWCNKRGCRAYIKKVELEEREKLKEAMFRGSANDPCLPNEYKVKLIREIWGMRCTAARNVDSRPPTPLTHRYTHLAAGTSTLAR